MAIDLKINADQNGTLKLSNERTQITIRSDGTVVVSTRDPLQLTGASLMKLDRAASSAPASKLAFSQFLEALERVE